MYKSDTVYKRITPPVFQSLPLKESIAIDSIEPMDYAKIYPRTSLRPVAQRILDKAKEQGFTSLIFKIRWVEEQRLNGYATPTVELLEPSAQSEVVQLVMYGEKDGVMIRYPLIFQ